MSRADHAVDRELPYATVQNDELVIPLADLARFVLRETTPDQLLDAVLADDTAREQWLEAVARRYRTPGLEDADRRKLISLLQAEVHDQALDKAVDALGMMERAAYSAVYTDAERRNFRYWRNGVASALREKFPEAFEYLRDRHGFETVFGETRDEAERYKLFGTDWTEAKGHWRKRAEERFTPPLPVSDAAKSNYLETDIAF